MSLDNKENQQPVAVIAGEEIFDDFFPSTMPDEQKKTILDFMIRNPKTVDAIDSIFIDMLSIPKSKAGKAFVDGLGAGGEKAVLTIRCTFRGGWVADVTPTRFPEKWWPGRATRVFVMEGRK